MTIRIALVDDNQTFVASVRDHLENEPGLLVVGQALNGLDALRLIEDLKPDVLLLDMAMPQMSGLDIAHNMRRLNHVPAIIFLTLHDGNSYRKAAAAAGAAGFVCKSNVVAELLPLIAQVAARRAGAMLEQP